ncbi:MAG: exodeoxyribonuclease VII large subunit [Gammaproteobacteria bacterium]
MNEIPDNPRDIYNVTRLNREVRAVLEGSFPSIWLQGEISNFACPASGHMYLTLKDIHSQVRCAMFKNKNRFLKFEPENGAEVLVRANVSLYEGRGEFQLIIEQMELAGEGGLQRAYEELKQKLFKEGLFDEDHRKPVPTMPKTIGVITSPTGAAIRDILSVLKRRYPAGNIIVYPVAVQGDGAAEQITTMLKTAEERNECDVIILSRGGGSIEDLWAFNNETLARAIFDCSVPVVSGIGHEIDFTIADFVADKRAATPSAAAELVSPDQMHVKQTLFLQQNRLIQILQTTLSTLKQNISHLAKRLPHPATQLQNNAQRLDAISIRMNHSIKSTVTQQNHRLHEQLSTLNKNSPLQRLKFCIEQSEQMYQRLQQATNHHYQNFNAQLQTLARALNTVSPLATLNRGYAIVQKYDNQEIVRDARQLVSGDEVLTRFSQGQAKCTVNEVFNNTDFDKDS